jgi:fluoride exporter
MNALWVALGGAIGAVARFGVSEIGVRLSHGFPWQTLAVNVVGCFAMGIVAGLLQIRQPLPDFLRPFLITGVLGGFTTFSAFALDFSVLVERQSHVEAFGYAVGSVVLSLVAVFAGLALTRSLV